MSLVPVLREAVSVLTPVVCAGCDDPDRSVCAACAALAVRAPVRWLLDTEAGALPILAAGEHEGRWRRLVLAVKRRGERRLVRVLAGALDRAITAALHTHSGAVLVRVPASRAGIAARGFDPVSVLVRATGRDSTRLRRVRDAGRQQGRSAADRRAAAAGSLAVRRRDRRRLAGRAVLIVDDVVTSGATCRAAVACVRAAGGTPVAVVCLSRRDRRSAGADPEHG